MKKRIGIFCIIIAVGFIFLAVWCQKTKTLTEIMRAGKTVTEFDMAYKTKANGAYDIHRVWVKTPEGAEAVRNVLEETKVSSMRVVLPPKDIQEEEVWYEVGELQNLHWVQITSSGKVYTGMPGVPQLNIAYVISDEEWQKCAAAFAEVMKLYGEESGI